MSTYHFARRHARLHMAFALREYAPGTPSDTTPPLAETLVEATAEHYPVLVDQAYESGFELCLGAPPASTAQVHIHDTLFTALTLIGDRHVLALPEPTELTRRWIDSAHAHGTVVIGILPPGTWPVCEPDCSERERLRLFNAQLRYATENAAILHGAALLIEE